MKIAFLLYPTTGIKVDEDSSFWIMRELNNRGHQVYHFESRDLYWDLNGVFARASVSQYHSNHGFVKTVKQAKIIQLDKMDVVFIRKEPPFDNEYLHSLQILSILKKNVFVLNDPIGIAACNEKLCILNFEKLIPPTFVSSNTSEIIKFVRFQKSKVVLKPLDNKGGAGIVVINGKDRNLPSILDQTTRYGRNKIMAQRYVSHDKTGDKRILLLNGEYLGCFIRIPSKVDFRANLSVGGRMRTAQLTSKDKKVIKALQPKLGDLGLYFTGVDVISGYLTEINVTSPSGIPEIKKLQNKNLEIKIADFIESYRP